VLAGVRRDLDLEPPLAVHLHGHDHRLLGGQRLVELGERLVGQRCGVPHLLPQRLGDVRGQRCHHQDQRLGHVAGHDPVPRRQPRPPHAAVACTPRPHTPTAPPPSPPPPPTPPCTPRPSG